MKPVYKMQIEPCLSPFEGMDALKQVQSYIDAILNSNEYKKIIQSEVPLYVHVFANPDAKQVENAGDYKNGVYVSATSEIENDFTIFAIMQRIGRISLPQQIDKCLIILSTQENLQKNEDKGDDETPIFIAKESNKTFDDIILADDVKEKLFRALAIIQNRDLIFDKWGFSKIDKATKSILCFYGPSGTGKTETAKAVGAYLNKKILFSSYAQIESQYVGVGAKNLHAIFKAAEEQDAILFFDEADSFLSNRLSKTESSSDKHYNRMSNELFQLLEEFNGCVIFATNLLTDVDKAFKSRIIDSIKFELPDEEARKAIINLMLPISFPLAQPLSEENLQKLVDISEGFSGRDIRKSILLALSNASIEYISGKKKLFDIDDIILGFETVKNEMREIDAEINGVSLSPEIGQELLDTQMFNEKLVSMAKLALYVENPNDVHAIRIYKEISRSILGTSDENIELSADETIGKVCEDIKNNQQRIELMDIAIKVVAADGEISSKENAFLIDVMANLSIPEDLAQKALEYSKCVADSNARLLSINSSICELIPN